MNRDSRQTQYINRILIKKNRETRRLPGRDEHRANTRQSKKGFQSLNFLFRNYFKAYRQSRAKRSADPAGLELARNFSWRWATERRGRMGEGRQRGRKTARSPGTAWKHGIHGNRDFADGLTLDFSVKPPCIELLQRFPRCPLRDNPLLALNPFGCTSNSQIDDDHVTPI